VAFNGVWTGGDYPFDLAPGAALRLGTDGLGPLVVGSVEVKSDIPVRSTLLFSGVPGLTGLAAARPATRLTLVVPSSFHSPGFGGLHELRAMLATSHGRGRNA